MVIRRRFVPFLHLYRQDKDFRKLADRFFSDENIPNRIKQYFQSREIQFSCLDNMKSDCTVPRQYFMELTDMFVRLDCEKPYDNHLTYEDVDEVKMIKVNRGKVVFALIKNETPENPKMFVGFARPSDESQFEDVYIPLPLF